LNFACLSITEHFIYGLIILVILFLTIIKSCEIYNEVSKKRFIFFGLKLIILPSLYIILFFVFFVIIMKMFFDISFSTKTYISFGLFYLLYLFIQSVFIAKAISPIIEITKKLKIFNPNQKPEKIEIKENDEIGILADNINKVYEMQWKYTQEIKEKQKRIEDLMKSRESFITALSHDLKSPIFSEQKLIESILADKENINAADFIEYLEDMYKINDELLRIVNNLLMACHLVSETLEIHYEKSDINEIIKNVQNTLKHLAKDENLVLSLDLEENIPEIKIDKDMISRVMTNLVSNAIKHSKTAGEVKITTKSVENSVRISIQDNGIGISEDEKENIFQRYPSSKRTIGTGLGLYISKQIIDAHKGKIWFESEKDKGTIFYFTLPIKT